ncbi:hypothetical protein [Actinacidiphila sp. ITFR-21]|uniref:hypothetical protein n=1 Tax=Actinacidiphila sp. ITFR-21 TaxID=3075199 RepID=UPI00288A8A9C|nr:hypothetical protein [Streptomyces sp. ITFR-21]WNI16363.1 hypothetical protein RLT57_13080 [Streptomyces sp. ITFR-21]
MIVRWARFVAGSYPPVISVLFAFAWAYGVTGLFAAVQPGSPPWRPGAGTAVSAVTLTVTLLLMRAVDDIRDLEYDRGFNPKRPLARGAVRVRDLLVLYAAGSVLVLAINSRSPAALAVLAGQLAYCLVVLAVDHWLRWPPGDNLPLSLLVSSPAQLLLHVYLYARYLDGSGRAPDHRAVLAIVITVLATAHLEFAKKVTRQPRPGERSYVDALGFPATVGIALTAPVVSVVLLLAGARATSALVPLAVLPLALPALAGWRFWRTPATRWPPAAPAFYVLLTFACYFVLGLSYT